MALGFIKKVFSFGKSKEDAAKPAEETAAPERPIEPVSEPPAAPQPIAEPAAPKPLPEPEPVAAVTLERPAPAERPQEAAISATTPIVPQVGPV